MVNNKSEALDERQHQKVKKMLLEGPNLIVADEAHTMRNPDSDISKVANLFKSNSRIAMTGSPLSNDLVEYWTMINWIDPAYLGPLSEFKQKYVQPINAGLYKVGILVTASPSFFSLSFVSRMAQIPTRITLLGDQLLPYSPRSLATRILTPPITYSLFLVYTNTIAITRIVVRRRSEPH